MKFTLLFILFASLLIAEKNFKSAQTCKECHEEIVTQWQKSIHAAAALGSDPLFAGMYSWAVTDSKGRLKEKCIVCHSPFSAVFGSLSPDVGYNKEGVTCQFCHGAAAITAFHSARDIRVEPDTIYSYQPEEENDAHPVAHRGYYQKSDLCLPCHARMSNPLNVPVCTTGAEWQSYFEKYGKTCQDCHMPENNGVPSHLFPGAHRGNRLKGAVKMTLDYERDPGLLKVTLTNTGAGHALPTGTPLRMVVLKIRGFDREGQLRWENWKSNPLKEDKSALFMKILADSSGRGPAPPWKATRILFEQRLMPDKPVQIEYKVEKKGLYRVEAELLYRLAPAAILQKFGISDPHFIAARSIIKKELRLTE